MDTKKSEHTALAQVDRIFDGDRTEAFAKYLDLIKKVPFDQSELAIEKFCIDVHVTEWRMLRQTLLSYDGKAYDVAHAKEGRKKSEAILQMTERVILRLSAYRRQVEDTGDLKALSGLSDLEVQYREGDNLLSRRISPAMTCVCYGDLKDAKQDILMEIDSHIILKEYEIRDAHLGEQQSAKLVIEAEQQLAFYERKLKELLPRVQKLEEQGITFESQEVEYWTQRFKKNVEMALLTSGSIDQGVLDSISLLPKSAQEDIIQFANRVRSESVQAQGALPVEFKSAVAASKRLLSSPDGSHEEVRMLAEHQRRVRVVVAKPRREEVDRYISDTDYLVNPPGVDATPLECYGMPIDRARNFCVQKFLEGNGDWLFFVDCDILLPRNALWQLLETAYDTSEFIPGADPKERVIGGYYTKKIEPPQSASVNYIPNPQWDGKGRDTQYMVVAAEPPLNNPNAVIDVNGILATGALLIHRSVLIHMGPDWFRELRTGDTGDMLSTDDYHFTQKAIDLGYRPKLHCGVRCIHVDKQRNVPYGDKDPKIQYCLDHSVMGVLVRGVANKTDKVLISIPRRGDWEHIETNPETLLGSKGLEWAFWNPVGLHCAAARNQAVETAIGNGCDWLLFIDNDIVVPKAIMDMLFCSGKSVVSGVYAMKAPDHRSAHFLLDDDQRVVHAPMDGTGLIKCNRTAALGCTLIRVDVLRDIKRQFTREDFEKLAAEGCTPENIGPWFVEFPAGPGKEPWAEDAFFTNTLIQSGYTPWLLLDCQCAHVARGKDRVRYYGRSDIVDRRSFELTEYGREVLAV